MERFFSAFGLEKPHVVETETRIDGVITSIQRNYVDASYYTLDYSSQLGKERVLNTAEPFVVDADFWLSEDEDEAYYYNATRYYNLSDIRGEDEGTGGEVTSANGLDDEKAPAK